MVTPGRRAGNATAPLVPPVDEEVAMAQDRAFLSDVKELRRRAREHMEAGAVTPAYRGNPAVVVRVLNQALATEMVCVLRYKRHYFMASGLTSEPIAEEFLDHANEEQAHADRIAVRITQLGGAPDLNPAGLLARSHSEYVEGEDLLDMIREDLVAERVAIESYSEIVRFLGDDDPTSRRIMEEVMAQEEEHADDLVKLLTKLDTGRR
jgi:bacterioferritin